MLNTRSLLSCSFPLFLSSDKRKQVSVDLILKCSGKAVRRTGIIDFFRAFDQLGRFFGRVLHWHDLIIFAVHDKRWHIELFEVLSEVGFGEGLDAIIGILKTGLHAP